jgi:hypothetical protein
MADPLNKVEGAWADSPLGVMLVSLVIALGRAAVSALLERRRNRKHHKHPKKAKA